MKMIEQETGGFTSAAPGGKIREALATREPTVPRVDACELWELCEHYRSTNIY